MVEELTKDSIKGRISNSSEPLIIDFYGDWCAPCKRLAPKFEKLSKEFKAIGFAKYNVDEDNKVFAIKLGITSVPSTITFWKGEEIDRISGDLSEDELREKIRDVINKTKNLK